MKKLIPIIALIPLVIMALTPPWLIDLDCNVNSLFWLWMVLISGFLTFALLYQNVSVWLKLLIIWCFIGCFLSRAPYISFTLFWTVLFCAYYYILCLKIEDFTIVKKAIQVVFFFVALLVIMQLFGKDTLLNFNQKTPAILGILGNKMISSTFVCVLAPFLIFNPLNWIAIALIVFISGSSGGVLALMMGGVVLVWCKTNKMKVTLIAALISVSLVSAFTSGDIKAFQGKAGRRQVWVKGIELTLKRPVGYGIATWRPLFPYMCGSGIRDQQPGKEWAQAHNSWVQFPFEIGIPGMIFFIGWIVSIIRKVKDPIKLSGLMILAGTMCTQFPDRVTNCVLIMIMFLAFLSVDERKENYGTS